MIFSRFFVHSGVLQTFECNVSNISILKKKKKCKPFLLTYTSIPARKKVIKFRDKIVVALIDNLSHYLIISNKSIPIDDKKCTAAMMTKTLCWKLPTKTVQQPQLATASTIVNTKNTFNVLENDDTYKPIQYKSR